MSNFKKVILLFLLLFVFEQGLAFALEPVTFRHYLELELNRKKAQSLQPDMVFIGNSRVSTCFIPSIFAQNMEEVSCAFNAGTGSQGIEGTYYYLKDILNQYDLKYVVVGLDYQTILREERQLKRDLVVLERLRSPLVKAQFIAGVFEPSEYVYFLKSYQYRDKIADACDNIKKKLSKEYRQGIDTGQDTVYEELGFTRETKVFGNRAGIYPSQPWEEEKIDPGKLAYLDKIIELCRDNEVQLYMVSTPLTISTVCTTKGYEECCRFFEEYLGERGIAYDNLNFMKDRQVLLPDAAMNGMEHVGGESADLVSDFYSRVLAGRIRNENVDDYFYESVADMEVHMSDVICCALHTETAEEEDGTVGGQQAGGRRIVGEAYCKEGVTAEYQFEVEHAGETTILQTYDTQNTCPLPGSRMIYPMTLRVRCRPVNGDGIERVFEVDIDENTWAQ